MPTIRTESAMIKLGQKLGQTLTPPTTIELVGDVGTGKTTLTKGIAEALDISDPITSPSFTLSKIYQSKTCILAHYDFYRLPDPGIMEQDLAESISDPHTITIVEWADTIRGILPKNHLKITIKYNNDGSRQVEITK